MSPQNHVLFFMFLFLFSSVFADDCYNYRFNINITTVAKIGGNIAAYPYPDYREGDYLSIQNLTITNIGTCNISESKLEIIIKPTHSEQNCFNSAVFLPMLYINQSYNVSYIPSNSCQMIETGTYEVLLKSNLSIYDPEINIYFNGDYFEEKGFTKPNFRVIPTTELKTIELATITKTLSERTLSLTALMFFFAFVQLLLSFLQTKQFIEYKYTRITLNTVFAITMVLASYFASLWNNFSSELSVAVAVSIGVIIFVSFNYNELKTLQLFGKKSKRKAKSLRFRTRRSEGKT